MQVLAVSTRMALLAAQGTYLHIALHDMLTTFINLHPNCCASEELKQAGAMGRIRVLY